MWIPLLVSAIHKYSTLLVMAKLITSPCISIVLTNLGATVSLISTISIPKVLKAINAYLLSVLTINEDIPGIDYLNYLIMPYSIRFYLSVTSTISTVYSSFVKII